MRNLQLAIVAIAAIAAAPAAGQADADPVERVAVSSLDLASVDGRRLLARRIAQATELACGSYAGKREYYEIDAIDQCRRRAKAEVARQVAAIDNRQLIRSA
ncbi:MAG: UrcA family protein, partial [Sphingomonas bacterium]|nr:UrcA family protein [Sphingomonas bacterium]